MVNTYFQRPSQSSFFKSSAENSTNSRQTYALTLTFPFCKMAIIVYHANILLLDNHTSIISFARIVSIINVALMNIETKVILASFLNNSTANLTLQPTELLLTKNNMYTWSICSELIAYKHYNSNYIMSPSYGQLYVHRLKLARRL